MRLANGLLLVLVPWYVILVLPAGCSSRMEVPVAEADSTLVYPAKKPGAPTATITLARGFRKKSGKPISPGRVFTIKKKAKVRARVEVDNLHGLGDRELMFHLVWLGPGEDAFYRKRIDHVPNDASTTFKSSISIEPEKREPGIYALKVYLFREMIAEKRFELKDREGTGGG